MKKAKCLIFKFLFRCSLHAGQKTRFKTVSSRENVLPRVYEKWTLFHMELFYQSAVAHDAQFLTFPLRTLSTEEKKLELNPSSPFS